MSAIIDLTSMEDQEDKCVPKEPKIFYNKCEAIIQSGKRKGEKCDCITMSRTEDATHLCGRHNREKRKIREKEECSICYEEMTIGYKSAKKLKNCSHTFHKKCLQKWVDMEKRTCPLCRTPMRVQQMFVFS